MGLPGVAVQRLVRPMPSGYESTLAFRSGIPHDWKSPYPQRTRKENQDLHLKLSAKHAGESLRHLYVWMQFFVEPALNAGILAWRRLLEGLWVLAERLQVLRISYFKCVTDRSNEKS